MSSSNKDLRSVYNRACSRPITKSSSKSARSIKPSMLGSPCMRKIFYSYNKVDEDVAFPLANARIMNLGNAIGKMLFDAFDKEGIVIKFRKPDGSYNTDYITGEPDYEFRVTSPELDIKLGKIDVTCVLDDGLWLVELKSINSNGYSELRAPKPDHLIQGILYLYLFNRTLLEGGYAHIEELAKFSKANGVRFLYYGKDRSELKEFVVTTADEMFKQIVTKIQQVKWFSETDQLPPMTPDYCSSCSWREKCKKNQKS